MRLSADRWPTRTFLWTLGRTVCAPLLLVAAAGSSVGCVADSPITFDSPAPSARLDAIAQASNHDDKESLAQLVRKLSAHDPAERMPAIRALERREGTTLGYHHGAPHWERLEAIERWRTRIGMTTQETPDPETNPESNP